MIINQKNRILEFLIIVAIFLSVISQMPLFVERSMTQLLSIPPWIIVLLLAIGANKGRVFFHDIIAPLILACLFYVFLVFLSIFEPAYRESALPYVIAVAMFMLIVGYQAGFSIERKTIEYMFISYIVAALILGVGVFFSYFMGVANVGTIYLYNEKNSTALILLTALIFLILSFNTRKIMSKIASVACVVFLIVLIVIMKSRAVYISLAIIGVLLIFNRNIRRPIKILCAVSIIVILVYILTHEQQFQYFIDEFVFAGRTANNLNNISSGRVVEWENFLSDLNDGWLFGHGKMKRESLILTAILEFGIPIGLLIIGIGCYPLKKARQFARIHTSNALVFWAIALCYTTNMFFEQLAPFGPGVKCFMLWLLLGMFLANPKLILEANSDQELDYV